MGHSIKIGQSRTLDGGSRLNRRLGSGGSERFSSAAGGDAAWLG
jgi:hypothetical protein